jgi:glyoxylase-like metal-dependent hydrolase (beta-lactamase superfamily II)
MSLLIQAFFDSVTMTISYVIYDVDAQECAIIDPVLDFDNRSGCTNTHSADRIVDFIQHHNLHTRWILETHAHADHLSGAQYLKQKLGGLIGIGAHITDVQQSFASLFNLSSSELPCDGSSFDRLFEDGDTIALGQLSIRIMHVPGHTPADVAYLIGNCIFVGDTLFMPDVGTARCDFSGGDAVQLYHSIKKILALPLTTRLFLCHDYPPPSRSATWECTVADQKHGNIHIHDGVHLEQFVAMRQQRDATLSAPALIWPSIQVNIRAGCFPTPEKNGQIYLKLPVNSL